MWKINGLASSRPPSCGSRVSGEIAANNPGDMVVRTPVATIGIRGTKVTGKAAAEGEENTLVLLADEDGSVGTITVTTKAGTVVMDTVNQPYSVASAFELPSQMNMSEVEFENTFGSVLSVLPPRPHREGPTSDEAEGEISEEAAAELGEIATAAGDDPAAETGAQVTSEAVAVTGDFFDAPVTVDALPPPPVVAPPAAVADGGEESDTDGDPETTTVGEDGDHTDPLENCEFVLRDGVLVCVFDILGGGAGSDFLAGGAGNDSLGGSSGSDSIGGGAGNDIVFGQRVAAISWPVVGETSMTIVWPIFSAIILSDGAGACFRLTMVLGIEGTIFGGALLSPTRFIAGAGGDSLAHSVQRQGVPVSGRVQALSGLVLAVRRPCLQQV